MEWELLTGHIAAGWTVFTADFLRSPQGEIWLVPMWLLSPDGKLRTPGRAIRVDRLPHQLHPMAGESGSDLTLNDPMPTAVLDGQTTRAEGFQYEVETGPSDRFGWMPIPRAS